MLHEVWIVGEVMVFAVLEDEDAAVFQQPAFEDEAGDGGQFLEGIRGIGEDEIKPLLARFNITEYIAPDNRGKWKVERGRRNVCGRSILFPHSTFLFPQNFLYALLYKPVMIPIQLYADNTAAAA